MEDMGFFAGDGDVVWHVAAWCPTFPTFCVFLSGTTFLKVLLMPSILMFSFLIFVAPNFNENYLYKLFVSDHFQETDQI